jgi:hypothetical protein
MTEAAIALRGPSAAMNPWLVAAAVVVPTFMEVLDTTIAVVALRYIAGGLAATVNDHRLIYPLNFPNWRNQLKRTQESCPSPR